MAKTRRKFLTLVGGGVVVAATGAGVFATTRTPHKALAPWRDAGNKRYEDPRLRALSYAVLAPNPHNRQPWLAELIGARQLTLYPDTTKLLPQTDPFARQIIIGFGCFIELLVQAAAAEGFVADVTLFPQGVDERKLDGRPVAAVTLAASSSIAPDPLFAHVLARRSHKEPFDATRAVDNDALDTLLGSVEGEVVAATTSDTARVATLRELTYEAWVTETSTPAKMQESIDVMRFGKTAINTQPDGIDMGGAVLEALNLAGLLTPATLADPTSQATASGYDLYRRICETAQAYVWLSTAANTRADQVAAGRAWLRVNLAATGIGLAVHPLSQALQEYSQMRPHYESIHTLLADGQQTVQMLGRLGYADAVPPSPRWPIEAKIRKA